MPYAVYRAYKRQEEKKNIVNIECDGHIKEYYDKRWLRILFVIWIRIFVNNNFFQYIRLLNKR